MNYIFLLLDIILINGFIYARFILEEVNFYEIAYGLKNHGGGKAAINVVKESIKLLAPYIIVSSIVLIIIYIFIPYKLVFTVLLFILLVILVLHTIGFFKYFINLFKKTNIYDYYINTNDVDIKFNEKKNLILLYLESTESSLFSKENGGTFKESVSPELEKIAKENINISNTDKLGGFYTLTKTAFTLASFVSSTSSTPVKTSLIKGYKKGMMKSVNTLYDVLTKEGYNLELIQGSDSVFSNIKLYLNSHGASYILDYNEAIRRKLIDKDYFVWWGFEDKKLFEFAKDELINLSKDNKPFALTMFTMDTHFNDGYVNEDFIGKSNNHFVNSYTCNSHMIGEFISWVKKQDFFKNTTIVIMGDHTLMQNSFYKKHKGYDRTVYNAIINSKPLSKNKNRVFSSFDMYPTILSSIGASIKGDRIGFGTNLYSDKKTLLEELGKDYFNKELLKRSKYEKNNF